MRKKTIGEVFYLERRNQGLSLEEVERLTDIQIDYLKAIEKDDFDLLPSPFYARSFLKKYAQTLDFDADIVLEAYENGSLITYDEVDIFPEDQYQMRRTRKRRSNFFPLFYLALFSIIVVTFISYFLWEHYQPSSQGSSDSSMTVIQKKEEESSISKTTSSEPSMSSSSSSNTQLQVRNDGEGLVATLSGVRDTATLTISIEGENSSWMSVTGTEWENGVTLSAENPSISTTLKSGTVTQITIGDTEGVSVKIDNQPIDLSSFTNLSGTINLTITE